MLNPSSTFIFLIGLIGASYIAHQSVGALNRIDVSSEIAKIRKLILDKAPEIAVSSVAILAIGLALRRGILMNDYNRELQRAQRYKEVKTKFANIWYKNKLCGLLYSNNFRRRCTSKP
jgi:hypothetical protein